MSNVKTFVLGSVVVLLCSSVALGRNQMREAPEPVAREGIVKAVHLLRHNSPPWRLTPTKGINHPDPDWTINARQLEGDSRPARMTLLKVIRNEGEAERLNSEINGKGGGAFCATLGIGLRLHPGTAPAAPYVAGACTIISSAIDTQRKKIAARVGDSVWRYDELCLPESGDDDERLVMRTVYFVLDCDEPVDFADVANRWLEASDEEREEIIEDLPRLDGTYYFLREDRIRVRVVN